MRNENNNLSLLSEVALPKLNQIPSLSFHLNLITYKKHQLYKQCTNFKGIHGSHKI